MSATNEPLDILLSPLAADDVAHVFELWSDEEATRLTNFPFLPTLPECSAHLQKMLAHYAKEPAHFGPFTVRSKSDEFLGLVGGDAADAIEGRYELWYFVVRHHWRRGVAKAAVRELLSLMEVSGRVRTVTAEAAVENAASRALLELFGFTQRPQFAAPSAASPGKTFDRYVYVLARLTDRSVSHGEQRR